VPRGAIKGSLVQIPKPSRRVPGGGALDKLLKYWHPQPFPP
jgi:hypothetical protein